MAPILPLISTEEDLENLMEDSSYKPCKDFPFFLSSSGELCYSKVISTGSGLTKIWHALFLYENGFSIHDGKSWIYRLRILQSSN
jgi:hypothetical protein